MLHLSCRPTYCRRAAAHSRKRTGRKRSTHFLQAVKAAPNSATAHKWLGMTYAAQEKFVLAEQPFRRACNIDPKEPDVCYYWGRTLYSLSRFDAALRAYERGRAAVAR